MQKEQMEEDTKWLKKEEKLLVRRKIFLELYIYITLYNIGLSLIFVIIHIACLLLFLRTQWFTRAQIFLRCVCPLIFKPISHVLSIIFSFQFIDMMYYVKNVQ